MPRQLREVVSYCASSIAAAGGGSVMLTTRSSAGIRLRGLRWLAVAGALALVAAACGDDAEVAATTTAPATTAAPATTTAPATTAAPATTGASTATPTVTFTGSECVYSGPDTLPSGEIVKFTLNNESSVEVVVYVLRLSAATLDDIAADVTYFPPAESWPPLGAQELDLTLDTREVDAGTEVTNNVLFSRAGDIGTICWPLDGSPALPGGLFTVEESSSTASPPTTLSLEVQEAALAVVEAFLAAFNAGDADVEIGLFIPEASISDNFGNDWVVAGWEMALAWDIAQGTILTPADCTVADVSSPDGVTVTCESGTFNAPAQAIGAVPVPTTLTFLVGSEGIRELEFFYGEPDFTIITAPLLRWVSRSYPEDIDKVGFGIWDSVEEAEQNGLLFAQYAEEWAAFLDASGCVYPNICFRTLTED